MPELPDIEAYLSALRPRVVDKVVRGITIMSPFVLRTFDPPIESAEGRSVSGVERLGKRIVLKLEGDLFLVIHLMIAGRLRWDAPPLGAKMPEPRISLARLRFDTGGLRLTEASTQKRASIHLVRGVDALASLNPGGIEPLACTLEAFQAALQRENRTLKRAMTDPAALSGIGNAYSDEVLHAAGLSPIALTSKLSYEQFAALFDATQSVLTLWSQRLREEFADRFPGPGDITAFRPDFAVHGKFKQPCPVCGTSVQRIVRADNEWNYCPRCQTGGKVLADRSLSRLLKDDWPRTIEELEA
jgi:formamidopyrimidine-DNA glycosylase